MWLRYFLQNPPDGITFLVTSWALFAAVYLLILPFEAGLAAMGMHPLAVSAAIWIGMNAWRALPKLALRWLEDDRQVRILHMAVGLSMVLAALFLFSGDPVWVQRLWTVLFGVRVAAMAWGFFVDEGLLGELRWHAQFWERGRLNAARGELLRYLSLIVVNEAAIRFASETEWVLIWAVACVAIPVLTWWTTLATHPWDENQEAEDG